MIFCLSKHGLISHMLLIAAVTLSSSSLAPAADLNPRQVPTFRVRARILAAGGQNTAGSNRKFHLDLAGAGADIKGNKWSPWLRFTLLQADRNLKDYPALYMHGWPVVVRLQVASGASDPTRIEAELQFDDGGDPIALSGELFGNNLGLTVWRDEQSRPYATTMAGYNQRYWNYFDRAAIPANDRPQKFPIVDRFIGGDDDRIDWREGINHLAGAGMSAVMLPPSRPTRDMLLSVGLKRTAWAVYSPPGYAFDYESDASPVKVHEWAQQQAKPYLDAGYAPRDMALFAMSDEPGWYYPEMYQKLRANPAGLARFRDYIKSQTLEPRDVGAAKWEDVLPLGRSGAKDLRSRRLFYWTQRFFAWDSARHFANATKELEAAFYPGLPIFTNWNNFSGRLYVPGPVANNAAKQDPDAAMGSHDWFEYAKLRGTTLLWTEDWFSDAEAYQWSFYCAKLRSAAARGGIEFGGYVIPRTAGDREDGILQKILSLVGHGGKAVEYFVFGPEYAFPGNCYSENSRVIGKMAEAHRLIARAESVLWPGRMPKPQVAILMPRSAELWDVKNIAVPNQISDATNNHLNNSTVDYMAEIFDLFLGLQHANIPADFLAEDDLSPEGLKPYRVVYVTEPNVPRENQQALADWVRSGGTLVTVSGAATLDRYNDPADVLARAIGIAMPRRERLLVANLQSLTPVGKGDGQCGPFAAVGAREKLSADGVAVLAKFDDGSAAVVSRTVGKGLAIHFAWLPGLSYVKSATKTQDKLPVGYSESVRHWIVLPTELAKVDISVKLDHPLVESPVLVSPAGAAITLLNWTGAPIANLKAELHLPFTVRSIESVTQGAIHFETSGERVTFNLPLRAADILVVKP
jgi:hypothetical protein